LKVRVKLKASSEKVWKLRVEMVKSCRKEAKKEPDAAADQAEQQGLHQEGREDTPPLKTERPQGADLADSIGDGGKHGDQGALKGSTEFSF
jgi:hypothetical protein